MELFQGRQCAVVVSPTFKQNNSSLICFMYDLLVKKKKNTSLILRKIGLTIIQNDVYTPLFIAALFTIARTWKLPRCPTKNVCSYGVHISSRPGPEPPPLPPRRRASAPNGPLDSASFAQLHEWYGQEVRALRSQWLSSQAQPSEAGGPGREGNRHQGQP